MKAPNVTTLKKYLTAMSKTKAKYVTSERLSKIIGQYPEVISENLSYFNPMITMDPSYNLLELIPQIKSFINDIEDKKAPKQNPLNPGKSGGTLVLPIGKGNGNNNNDDADEEMLKEMARMQAEIAALKKQNKQKRH